MKDEIIVRLNDLINRIDDDEVRTYVGQFILDNVDLDTFIKPASSSGKYHPYETRFIGGLMKHTEYVVNAADVIMEADPYYTKHPKHVSYVRAACILHDAFKYGIKCNSQYTINDHPEVGYKQLVKFMFTMRNMDDLPVSLRTRLMILRIARIVRSHHGKWGDHPCNTKDKLTVHMADMIASRLHKIEMRVEVPENAKEVAEDFGRAFNVINNAQLTPEVITSFYYALVKDPSKLVDDCLNEAIKEWNK